MTDALIEKVARAISPCDKVEGWGRCETICPACDEQACAAILAVLDHFSEPGNVTRDMGLVAMERHNTIGGDWRHTIAAAMRAAKEEFLK